MEAGLGVRAALTIHVRQRLRRGLLPARELTRGESFFSRLVAFSVLSSLRSCRSRRGADRLSASAASRYLSTRRPWSSTSPIHPVSQARARPNQLVLASAGAARLPPSCKSAAYHFPGSGLGDVTHLESAPFLDQRVVPAANQNPPLFAPSQVSQPASPQCASVARAASAWGRRQSA